MSRNIFKARTVLRKELKAIRRQIAAVDLLCLGNLQKRMKTCGKPGCPCLKNKNQRHGPYYEWTRRENGVFKNSIISKNEAEKLRKAIAEYHKVMCFLSKWGHKSAAIIIAQPS